jgi:hypothetical protein
MMHNTHTDLHLIATDQFRNKIRQKVVAGDPDELEYRAARLLSEVVDALAGPNVAPKLVADLPTYALAIADRIQSGAWAKPSKTIEYFDSSDPDEPIPAQFGNINLKKLKQYWIRNGQPYTEHQVYLAERLLASNYPDGGYSFDNKDVEAIVFNYILATQTDPNGIWYLLAGPDPIFFSVKELFEYLSKPDLFGDARKKYASKQLYFEYNTIKDIIKARMKKLYNLHSGDDITRTGRRSPIEDREDEHEDITD